MAIDDIVKNIDYMKVKAPSGLTYAQELVNAANLLRECIQKRIKQETMQDSLTTADLADVRVEGNRLTVALTVQNAIRPSIFKRWNKKDANVFWLLNDGFTVKKDWCFDWAGAAKERFTIRKAHKWVEDGIEEFNRINTLGIKIDVKRDVIRPLFYYGRQM